MPHVCLVGLAGFRIVDPALRELGLSLPGLRRRGQAIGALPCLGLLTIAAHTPENWTQSFHEAASIDDVLESEIADLEPRLVAISALSASIEEAYDLCARMRRRGIATVIGGLHATALPGEVLAHADAVVIGDGEVVWPIVLAAADTGTLRGAYRSDRFELGQSRLPRWDLMPQRRHRFTVQTARGCPLACEFCGASRLLGPFREKRADQVEQELLAVRRMDPAAVIELADDNTFAGARDPDALLAALTRAGLPWFTECDWRIASRPGLAAEMARAGCAQVLVGIESPVYSYRGMGAKAAPLLRVFEAIEAMQEAGLAVNACFVAGADGESRDSLDKLTEVVLACPAAEIQVTLQTPFPGTALRARLSRAGRLLESRTWKHHTLFELTYRPDKMTVPELEAAYRQLLATVHSPVESSRRGMIRRRTWRRMPELDASE